MAFLFFVIGLFDFKCRLVACIERKYDGSFQSTFYILSRAFATLPPSLATATFSRKVSGCLLLDNAVVVTSASIFKTSSMSVILSRKFSFFYPLSSLYSLTDNPLHALVISSVKMAYSLPS